MNRLIKLLSIAAFTCIGSTAFAQTEDYYKNAGCKVLYFEVNSSKVKIFYGNGMDEEISGKPEMLTITLSNTFIKSGYELTSVIPKTVNGQTIPGYFFFQRKTTED